MALTPRNVVSKTGAGPGCVLAGVAPNNRGFRVRLLHAHPRGDGGPIKGPFRVIGLGDNKHAKALECLLGQTTDAESVLRVIRQEHPACVNVVNANGLVVEETSSLVPCRNESLLSLPAGRTAPPGPRPRQGAAARLLSKGT